MPFRPELFILFCAVAIRGRLIEAGYRCREAKCGPASQLGRTDYRTDLNVPSDAAFYLHDKMSVMRCALLHKPIGCKGCGSAVPRGGKALF